MDGAGPIQYDDRMTERDSVGALAELLRFSEGDIRIGGERLLLLHGRAFSDLREQLLAQLGTDRTRSLLMRIGFTAGASDARATLRHHPDLSMLQAFRIGPKLHGLLGMVRAELLELEADVEKSHFFGEFVWHESFEADVHVAKVGVSTDPVCWMQCGYASGFASTFMGHEILFRELSCRGAGADSCRLVARDVESWEDDAPEVRAFRAGPAREPSSPAHEAAASHRVSDVVGASSGFAAAVHKVEQAADTNVSVLFLGETGVGKERFARLLHQLSRRDAGPFIGLNCAAIPENLMEAELFGVEAGAFTDAQSSRRGRFERAHGGTIFLDEVGLMSLGAQAKLLRVLQERKVERVGGEEPVSVDVRVVAATNLELEQEVADHRFRADLYYRLNVFPIAIPPLRERRDDIPALCGHFLDRYCKEHKKHITGITEPGLALLLDYEFPGNVRELENMIERGVILAPNDGPIDVRHLLLPPTQLGARFGIAADGRLERVHHRNSSRLDQLIDDALEDEVGFDELERRYLERTVAQLEGNLSAAARKLGLTRRQLDYRLHRKHRRKGD